MFSSFFNEEENSCAFELDNQSNAESIESWTDFYKDDGNILLSKAATYERYEDFENAYWIEYGSMPLHHAVKSNKVDIVKKILLKGTFVNKADSLTSTPLYYAILMDNVEIVQLLLTNGAQANDCFIENAINFTYFQRVCQSSNSKIVKLFLNHGCDANEIFTSDYWNCPKYSRPLHLAIIHKRLETMQLLINYNANINDTNEYGQTPLYVACNENYVEAVELLLNKNALVNVHANDHTTALYQGIKCANHKIVKLLLSHGAFIEEDDAPINICDPVHEVITKGNLEMVKDLLSHGLNVNMKSSMLTKNQSFLHTAVDFEQIEIVDLLLKFNADINAKDDSGRTPLHLSTITENEVMMELLLQYDTNLKVLPEYSTLHSIDQENLTPFHMACKGTNIECIKFLIQCGTDVNAENFKGETALHFACNVGDLSIVKLLIENGSSINTSTEDNTSPLHVAVQCGHEQIVELLLMSQAVTTCKDKNGKIPLEYAVDKIDMKNIELLLQYNPDVNNDQYRKIFLSVLNFHETLGREIIDYFFKYGFVLKLEDKNKNVIFNAVTNGYYGIVKQLLDEGVDSNTNVEGSTLLHSATKNHHSDIIELLIRYSADVRAKDHSNKIPIFYAIDNNNKTIVELYLNSGVNVDDYPDILHYTIVKCSPNCKEMIEILLKYGADINYCDKHGVNAVHLIIQFLRRDIREDYTLSKLNENVLCESIVQTVDYLLEKGVNVNAKTKFGWTALHMAIILDEKLDKLVEILLKYDIDVDCKDELGGTPLHLCCQKGNFKIIPMLLNFGADINIEDLNGKTPIDAVFEIKSEHQLKAQELSTAVFVNCVEDLISSYFVTRAYIDFCNKAVAIFLNHIIKLKMAKLYLSPKNNKYVDRRQKNFQATCEKEINDLKNLRINSYVSVYDVLIKNITEVSRYIKNKNIQNICEILENPLKFPLYGSMIIERLKKASRRETLIVKAKEVLNILSNFGLPDACSEHIIIYLKNEDLKNLTNIVAS